MSTPATPDRPHRHRHDLRFGENVEVYEFPRSRLPMASPSAGVARSLSHPVLPDWWELHNGHSGTELVVGGLTGLSLSDQAAARPFEIQDVQRIVSSVLGLLNEAHERGITHGRVHQDLIWLDGPRVRLVGLGVQWATSPSPSDDDLRALGSLGHWLLEHSAEHGADTNELPPGLEAVLSGLEDGSLAGRDALRELSDTAVNHASPGPKVDETPPPNTEASLIGRENELAALDALLKSRPLVTLLAPGGMGKTSLARAILQSRRGAFVDLKDAQDEVQVARAVMTALGLDSTYQEDQDDLFIRVTQGQGLLIVLDNVEQVAGDVGVLLNRWFERDTDARFLVTTRVALGHPAETIFELGPLASDHAIQLFMEQARHRDPAFDAPVAAIHTMVVGLDQIPLSVILAASRAASMPFAELQGGLERATQREGAERGSRHVSMRSTLDWSWSLLDAVEQDALLRLSACRGGFTIELAEALLSGTTVRSVVDVLSKLRSASWVRELESEADTPRRFGFYAPIQDDLAHRLAVDPLRERHIEDAHAEVVLALGERLVDGLVRHGGHALLKWLRMELDNLEVVAQRFLDRRREWAVRAWLASAPAITAYSHLQAQLAFTAKLWEAGQRIPHLRLRAGLFRVTALARHFSMTEARVFIEPLIQEARGAADRSLLARVLVQRGRLHYLEGDAEGARATFDEAAMHAEAVGDLQALTEAIVNTPVGGPRDRALEARALSSTRTAGYELGEACVLYSMSIGETDSVLQAARLQRALELCHDVGMLGLRIRIDLAYAHWSHRDNDQALRNIDEAEAFANRRGLGRITATASLRALMFLERNDLAAARAVVRTLDASPGRPTHPFDQSSIAALDATLDAVGGTPADVQARMMDALVGAAPTTIVALPRLAELLTSTAGASDRPAAVQAAAQAHSSEPGFWGLMEAFVVALVRWSESIETPRLSPTRTLHVGPDVNWIALGTGPRVELARRGAARRILQFLLQARREQPGQGASRDDLINAGWPNEKTLYETANNRLYVLLARLRRDGLRDVIITRDDGYLIDPSLDLENGSDP